MFFTSCSVCLVVRILITLHIGEASPCTSNQHCSSCDADTGRCLTECYTGYYGPGCRLPCSSGCKYDTCRLNYGGTEICSSGCKPGYYGVRCSVPCRQPEQSEPCQKCPQDCEDGFCQLGTTCVSGCQDSYYGTNCIECEPGCSDCDRTSGSCQIMKLSTTTTQVTASPCTSNQHCSSCDADTGRCLTECYTGYYGPGCRLPCSSGCKYDTCRLNYGGIEICSSGCKLGYYGARCSVHCRQPEPTEPCQKCPQECEDGFCQLGTTCVSGCQDSYYGTNCIECEPGCSDCNRTSGSCEIMKLSTTTTQVTELEANQMSHPYPIYLIIWAACNSTVVVAILILVIIVFRRRKCFSMLNKKYQHPREMVVCDGAYLDAVPSSGTYNQASLHYYETPK